jgi:uncharacterized protein
MGSTASGLLKVKMKSVKSKDAVRFSCDPYRSLRTDESEHWLREGVKQGDLWRIWQLALLLKETKKRGPQMVEAIRLFKRAALRGYAPAEFSYGVALSFGEGVPRNKKAALFWYRRSAAHGFPAAAYNVGHFLENGIACAADQEKAAHWYRIAANMGDSDAEVSLGNLWEDHMRSTQIFEHEKWVLFWYRQAAKHGNPNGIFNLALCYLHKLGVKKNRRTYMRLLTKAAKAGQVTAKKFLRRKPARGERNRPWHAYPIRSVP